MLNKMKAVAAEKAAAASAAIAEQQAKMQKPEQASNANALPPPGAEEGGEMEVRSEAGGNWRTGFFYYADASDTMYEYEFKGSKDQLSAWEITGAVDIKAPPGFAGLKKRGGRFDLERKNGGVVSFATGRGDKGESEKNRWLQIFGKDTSLELTVEKLDLGTELDNSSDAGGAAPAKKPSLLKSMTDSAVKTANAALTLKDDLANGKDDDLKDQVLTGDLPYATGIERSEHRTRAEEAMEKQYAEMEEELRADVIESAAAELDFHRSGADGSPSPVACPIAGMSDRPSPYVDEYSDCTDAYFKRKYQGDTTKFYPRRVVISGGEGRPVYLKVYAMSGGKPASALCVSSVQTANT